MHRDQRPPVVVGVPNGTPWYRLRRCGRIRWGHLLQHEQPDEIRSAGCQIVRCDGAHRVPNYDRREHTDLLQEPHNVITHRLEGVVPHPLAAAMPARIGRNHAEVLPEFGCDVPPAFA
jgi:hypothetical protein